MASSQIKSESVAGPGPGAFPFAWNSPPVAGSETVVTTLRSDPYIVTPEPVDKDLPPDLLKRLFPTDLDVDDSWGIRLDHFTIQRRIGVGGMGSVFLATDEQLRRSVALKVLSFTLTSDPAAVLRFQNEARAAARLDHDNIARIFYYGEDAGLHYIAYEYIPGSNLRDVIRSKERLAPAEAVNYTMQLAAALSHTSAMGVVHRDIKPSNVLITPQGRAKLVDLGLARKESADNTSAELTVAGTTLGTFDYISPEQAKDPRSVDVRSDIYSLGCTLYHMLTGEPPYPEGTVLQKLLDHQGKEPPDPAKKNRRVPPALSAIVRKMMASEPRNRYSSPARLLSDLLKVARLLGTGAVPIDGQVWLTATRTNQPPWQGNIGWIATASALLVLVLAMERFPELSRPLNPRNSQQSISSNNSRPTNPGEVIDPSATGAQPIPSSTAHGNGSKAASTAKSGSSTGSTSASTILPKTDLVSPDSVFEMPLLSNRPSVDTEFVTAPDKSRRPQVPEMKPGDDLEPPFSATPGSPVDVRPGTPNPTRERPAEIRPVISIVGGKSYASLEAACSEAKDGTVIELRYNGRRGQAEKPIRLTNKENVIIRSGIGYRPVIEFAPTEPPTDAESRMITVRGGSLQLDNVDILLVVPERITTDRWAVFSLEQQRELQIHDVTVTVENPGAQFACVIEQKAAPGPGVGNMGMIKPGMPIDPPRVSINDTLVRGDCDLILLKDAVSARFQLKDAVVALQGSLLHANCQAEMTSASRDGVSLVLDFTTCLTSDGLVLTEGGNQGMDHTPPITVSAHDNIFWTDPNHPLVAMLDDLMEMQRRFVWTGDRNHYDSLGTFWQLGGRPGTPPAKQVPFEVWQNTWENGDETNSSNAPIKWRNVPPRRGWTKIDATSVELDPMATPAGQVVGATLNKLPRPADAPGPANVEDIDD